MIAVTFALPEESKDFAAGGETAVWHTGVGPERCAARLSALLEKERPEYIISAGFAGGLDPGLAPGAVFVAENYSSPALLEAARRVPGERFYGRLSTQERVVESVEAKRVLFERTGAAAVDMETETIFRLCETRGIPLLSVRAISDAAGEPLPVPYAVWFNAATQRPRVGSLLWFLATRPARVPAFARFVGNVGRARKALAAFLAALLRE